MVDSIVTAAQDLVRDTRGATSAPVAARAPSCALHPRRLGNRRSYE
jgi:hypothetical protein